MESLEFSTCASTSVEVSVASARASATPPVVLSAGAYLVAGSHMDYVAQAQRGGGAEELSNLLRRAFASGQPYMDIRETVVSLSLALNHLKKIAPRFRGFPSASFGGGSYSENQLSLDKQFIDLHWLKSKGHSKEVGSKKFASLFRGEDFPECADRFSELDWKSGTKTKALNIRDGLQWELAFFQDESIRKYWHLILKGEVRGSVIKVKGVEHIRCLLESSIEGQPNFERYLESWVEVWKAHKIAAHCGMPLTKTYELMTGKVVDPSTLSKKRDNVLQRINKKR